jgi:hypothetical protein
MFVAVATDDSMGFAPQSVAIYQKWLIAHKSAALHMTRRAATASECESRTFLRITGSTGCQLVAITGFSEQVSPNNIGL